VLIEIGHFALILAFGIALVQTAVPGFGAWRRDERLMAMARPAAQAQVLLVLVAFLALMQAYVTSDFSVENVVRNSHSAKPLLYKISGVWGNHEGSMVLWVLMLALFGALVATFGSNLPARLQALVLSVQGSISVAFLLFILLASNPFLRIDPAPADGQGLNPILQDPALAFHPPFLYAGYVGFSMAFSFAVAALIEGKVDAVWARWVRPWTLLAWMCLTLGIAMGSWWAYYTLGWGGWWFWDPVENASFMPWLAGTALLHSALVMEKREALKVWTILLAILTFSLSLLGTFLVRSGVLTSVHAFAVDPARGSFILMIMAVFVGGSLTLFAWRARAMQQGGVFAPISREGGLVLNNVFLTVSCGAVLIGTLYPLLLEAVTGAKISVGAPYFNLVFGLLMLPLLLALPFGPMLAWKRGDLPGAAQRLFAAAALAIGTWVLCLVILRRGPWLAPFGLALGVWVMAGAITELAHRVRVGVAPWDEVWRRLRNLPRSAFGTTLAHFGVGVSVIGIVATTNWPSEEIVSLKPGQTVAIAGYDVAFRGVQPRPGPNYQDQVGMFDVARRGRAVTVLESARRRFNVERQTVTQAGIFNAWRGDLYIVLGEAADDAGGAHTVRVYFHPFVRLIWFGAVLMFLAGMLSLSDRRLRVGAPRAARAGREASSVPAE
jgi:cytochrome c-type biogenesis protein CcmF